MAGTRLLLQSIVLIELIIIVWISIQYGFCYHTSSSQGTSPTTKDIPRLIFLTDNNSDDPKMNQEWWEESLCHPIHSILISKYFDFDFEGNDHDKAVEDEVVEESDNDSNDLIDLSLFEQFYKNTKITLVLENVTQLTYWIDYFTNELSELVLVQLDDTDTNDDDNTDNNTDNTEYANNNFKMDLEIIRPAAALLAPLLEEEEKEDDQDQLLWENYLNQQSSASISTINTNTADHQHNLVIYVPSNLLLLLDEAPSPSWKSIEEGNVNVNVNANPSETTMTKMTMIVPALLSSSSLSSTSSSSPLKSLIESWMIRSTIDISSSSSHKTSSNKNRKNRKSSSAKKRKKLVRNFPFEHFLAVLMPLLFPLLFPFVISWIKEYLRYKNMNKLKKEDKDKISNAEEENTNTNTNTNTNKLKDKKEI